MKLGLGRTERRIVLAIVVTAIIPLVVALWLGRTAVTRISSLAFQPEVSAQLDRSLELHTALVKTTRDYLKAQADLAASAPEILALSPSTPREVSEAALGSLAQMCPNLVAVTLQDGDGRPLGHKTFRATDAATDRALVQLRSIGDGALALELTLVAPLAHASGPNGAETLVRSYHALTTTNRTELVDRTYLGAFGLLLVATVAFALVIGIRTARPVLMRIRNLRNAMQPVALGDLSVRVDASGTDELAELAVSFNTMLAELEQNRSRIEFLKRMGEWQKVARRLAHEIKNPLTPIQLAVEECQKRCPDSAGDFRRVVDTMADVVTEEIASLRRLVTEFSQFARLPKPALVRCDLTKFLRDEQDRWLLASGNESERVASEEDWLRHIAFEVDLPDASVWAVIDQEMVHRALTNLIQNSAHAMRDKSGAAAFWGHVFVRLQADARRATLWVEDEGPGIAPEIADSLFEPYVTTKKDGTGLGLAMVKKIMVEHGGDITFDRSPRGGARVRLEFPLEGIARVVPSPESDPPPSGR